MKQQVCILGSTGSIGSNALDVIQRNREEYKVVCLTANTNVEKMFQQCVEFHPKLAVMQDHQAAQQLASLLEQNKITTVVKSGSESLVEAVELEEVSTVLAAIVGAAGLLPTLAAVERGIKVLLANKEALVMSGELFMNTVKDSGALLLPVDSEHNAIFQCLSKNETSHSQVSTQGLHKIFLTGSGGPFRNLPLNQLSEVTPEQACAHPNWDMGKKISVDSATMMNKGLELIEACFLFGVSLEKIDIVIHPQSIVHSMVSYEDGSVLAQMGRPDMRTPIAHTLAWPERIDAGVEPLDFYSMNSLTFESPDYNRFPCLGLAERAMMMGGIAPCVINAANEIAVDAFLNNKIRFTHIAKIIQETLDNTQMESASSIQHIIDRDKKSRKKATELVEKIGSTL